MKAEVQLFNLAGDEKACATVEVDVTRGLAQGVLELMRSEPFDAWVGDPLQAYEIRQWDLKSAVREVELENGGEVLGMVHVTQLCQGCSKPTRGDVCMDCALPSAGVAHA